MDKDRAFGPDWYLVRAGKKYGPISDADLFRFAGEGRVQPDDLVWKRGFDEWRPAGSVPGLLSPPAAINQKAPPSPPGRPKASERTKRAPVFLILATCALVLGLFTPRLLLFFPVMATLAFGVISLFREKAAARAVVVIGLAVGLVALNQVDLSAPTSSNLAAAEIVDWNWEADRDFGTRGTIKWNVEVRNKSDKNISSARRVAFTTYDQQGKLVSSTFTFVKAIPPGQTRSDNSYADFYGTEHKAQVKLTAIRFAR